MNDHRAAVIVNIQGSAAAVSVRVFDINVNRTAVVFHFVFAEIRRIDINDRRLRKILFLVCVYHNSITVLIYLRFFSFF